MLTLCYTDSALEIYPMEMHIYVYQDIQGIHSDTNFDRPNLETPQMSINGKMDKYAVL